MIFPLHRFCLLGVLLLLAKTVSAIEVASDGPDRPNVLFIAIDDLRTALGCYGDPLAQTPHIDRLASQGRLFRGAYAQQAVCGPSRASLMTGKVPDNIRVWHNRHLFRDTFPDLVTLPELFKNDGYHTLSIGKTFSGNPKEEDPRSWSEPFILRQEGWETYAEAASQRGSGKGLPYEAADVPDDGYIEGKMTRLAIERLGRFKAEEQPFFLAVGYFKPHLPFNAPKTYWDLYDPAQFDLAPQAPAVLDAPDLAYHTHRELGGYVGVPKDERLTEEETRVLRHGYYACVSYVDAQIGQLLEALEALDLARNTIVVLWGDHGFALGEVSRWCKGTNFEADTRVPLIIRAPGMSAPGVPTDSLVGLVDIYPTLAEVAGLEAPGDLDGQSLKALLDDPRARGRETVMSQFTRPWNSREPETMGYSLRTPAHRYTRWIDWKSGATLVEELYDYADSSSVSNVGGYEFEVRNVVTSAEHGEVLETLRAKMDTALKVTPPEDVPQDLLTQDLPGRKVFGVHDASGLPPLSAGIMTRQGWLRPDRFFPRFSTSLSADGEAVDLFEEGDTVVASAQLVLVVGESMRSIAPDSVRAALAGFTIGMDVVEEARYAAREWMVARAPDGWSPVATRLLPMDLLEKVSVETLFEGEVSLTYTVADLEYAIEDLVSFISTTQTLLPGDLIYLGVPTALKAQRPTLVAGRTIGARAGEWIEIHHPVRQRPAPLMGESHEQSVGSAAGPVERFVRVQVAGEARYGRIEEDAIRLLEGDIFSGVIPSEVMLPLDTPDRLPPVQPGKIFCVTRNTPVEVPLDAETLLAELPERIRWKSAGSVVLTGGPILLPRLAENLDWEAELIIVMGKEARDVPQDTAMEHVFGFVAGNDVSENDWGGLAGKSHESWGVMGHELVRGVDWRSAHVTTRVNRELVQEGSLRNVRYPVEAIVSFLSRYFTLLPGDMIYAGTVARLEGSPAAMSDGDLVEVHIAGVGSTADTVQRIERSPGFPERP